MIQRALRKPSGIDGTRLLYSYLQKDLLLSDVWLFQMLTARLIVDLGVWLPPSVYRCLPILVPYAVRDSDSRGNKALGIADQWGSPNRDGVFRDDNSLVKGIPKSLRIESRLNVYKNTAIDKGFVAAHVWRRISTGALSTRARSTYSFVPNIVWLPAEVAKLTDREESFVQSFVQAVAVKIYRSVKLTSAMQAIVDSAWAVLPEASGIPPQALPSREDLNFFAATPAWLQRRLRKIKEVVTALDEARTGPLTRKIISERYTSGLPSVDHERLDQLRTELDEYARASEDALSRERSV